MGGAAARVTAMWEGGRLGADAYRRLVGVLDVFDEFGDPVVVESGATVHMTWAVGRVTLTVSVGATGFWGLAATRGVRGALCHVGSFADAGGASEFGSLLMLAKAVLVEEVVVTAERKLNAAGGRPVLRRKPEPE